jgi:Ni/Fe-hydrogenase subunit HybB-like protein
VHSVVSWDFALSVVPGWHTTIFAPYFVAGAIHSGLAMVVTLMIPLRIIFKYEAIITDRVLESVAKTIVFTGLIVGFAYATEIFIAWYSHNPVEVESFRWRAFGDYALEYWIMVTCNTIVPLLLLFKKVRTNIRVLFVISLLVNVGMWYERFVIIIGSVAHDFLPHAWGLYSPSWVEFGIMIGSFCLFFFLFVLFVKHMPSVSMTEMKETLHEGAHPMPADTVSIMGIFSSEHKPPRPSTGCGKRPGPSSGSTAPSPATPSNTPWNCPKAGWAGLPWPAASSGSSPDFSWRPSPPCAGR